MNRRSHNIFPLLSLALLIACSGCTWTIQPPTQRSSDAVPVYIVDYGWHSGILLPTGKAPNQYLEYVLGDWGYAAQGHTSPFDVMGALFASNQGALGRRTVTIDPIDPHITNAKQVGKLVRIDVSQSRITALLEEMDRRYAKGTDTTYNQWNGQTYVKIPDHYSWANSCNTMTRDNMQQLGCMVSGSVIFSNFKVKPVPGVSTGSWLPPVQDHSPSATAHTEPTTQASASEK